MMKTSFINSPILTMPFITSFLIAYLFPYNKFSA